MDKKEKDALRMCGSDSRGDMEGEEEEEEEEEEMMGGGCGEEKLVWVGGMGRWLLDGYGVKWEEELGGWRGE